jgi:hypothetical protein
MVASDKRSSLFRLRFKEEKGKKFDDNDDNSLAKLLQKFRLEPTPDTKLNFHKGSFFMLIYDDIKVKFVPRNN